MVSREVIILVGAIVLGLGAVAITAVVWRILKKNRTRTNWQLGLKDEQEGKLAAQNHLKEIRAKPGDIIFFRSPDNSKHPDIVLVVCETPGEDAHLVSDGVVSRIWYSRFFVRSHLDRMRVIRRDDTSAANQQELIVCGLMLAEQIKRNAHDVFGSPLAHESDYWEGR